MNEVFADKSQEQEMCMNAMTNLRKKLLDLIEDVANGVYSQGISFSETSVRCALCKQLITQRGKYAEYRENWPK